MVKKEIIMLIFLFGLLFSISFVLSEGLFEFNPNIDFKAQPDSAYVIKISDALTAHGIKSVLVEVGQSGREVVNFGTNSEMVNIAVFLIENRTTFFKNGTYLEKTMPGAFSADELILLNIRDGLYNTLTFEGEEGTAPIDYTPEPVESEEENETVGNEVVDESEEAEEETVGAGITGMAVSATGFFKSNILYLVIGLVVIVGAIVFLVMRGKIHSYGTGGSESQPRTVKLSELKGQSHDNQISSAEVRLQKAEKELKNARDQISKIKNEKTELSEAEEQFKKAKEKLDGLKDSEDK
tara:strand:+ start:4784 stop:5671 length:888 start_codon:yes stop_codon:yes gene_type:complete